MIRLCDFCQLDLDTSKDRWLFQDDGSYIHIDCIAPALEEYKAMLDEMCPTKDSLLRESIESHDFKLLSKVDPREPFLDGQINWHETCEWCGAVTDSPQIGHVCPEQI